MPFEIAPKEVSVADKLAALIEAGRASHPDLQHLRNTWKGEKGVCAMSFAYLAASIDPVLGGEGRNALATVMNCNVDELDDLMRGVIEMNDWNHADLPSICEALRAGRVKPRISDAMISFQPSYGWIKTYAKVMAVQQGSVIKIITNLYGDADKFDPVVFAPKLMETVELPYKAPAKKFRKSAKNGATWPVAKHAYA